MMNLLKDFIKEEKGQTIVEWIVILTLILIFIIAILTSIGKKSQKKSSDIDKALS